MLVTKWHSNHTVYAEILIIEFPQCEKLIHDLFLLSSTSSIWQITRVFQHADDIEICAHAIENRE